MNAEEGENEERGENPQTVEPAKEVDSQGCEELLLVRRPEVEDRELPRVIRGLARNYLQVRRNVAACVKSPRKRVDAHPRESHGKFKFVST